MDPVEGLNVGPTASPHRCTAAGPSAFVREEAAVRALKRRAANAGLSVPREP